MFFRNFHMSVASRWKEMEQYVVNGWLKLIAMGSFNNHVDKKRGVGGPNQLKNVNVEGAHSGDQ